MNMPSLIFFLISAEQDFLRSSFVTDESNMIQGAPSASHLESPHLGVDLMVLVTFAFAIYCYYLCM